MSASAASHPPPAYPARAPWGTAGRLRELLTRRVVHQVTVVT